MSAAPSGPWNTSNLRQPPRVEWVQRAGAMRSLYYYNEPYQGHPTRVFAYFAVPENRSGPLPAMVLVHGGGGRAFPEWAKMWAQRGYAAVAMDLAGNGPDGERLPDAGPAETDQVIFYEATSKLTDAWLYHAVAAVIRAVSFLQQQPEVDQQRIGITGISWGGVVTCIAVGIDTRLKVAIPVYGCGYLYSNSAWKPIFDDFPTDTRQQWIKNFDPSQYLANVSIPIMWINGTNDFAFPLDSYQQSYRLPRGPRWLHITTQMRHGHREGWEPIEICAMADYILKGGLPPARIDRELLMGSSVQVRFVSPQRVERAEMIYTLDHAQWRDREWHAVPLSVAGNLASGELPSSRPITYFINATTIDGSVVSSEHRELLPR